MIKYIPIRVSVVIVWYFGETQLCKRWKVKIPIVLIVRSSSFIIFFFWLKAYSSIFFFCSTFIKLLIMHVYYWQMEKMEWRCPKLLALYVSYQYILEKWWKYYFDHLICFNNSYFLFKRISSFFFLNKVLSFCGMSLSKKVTRRFFGHMKIWLIFIPVGKEYIPSKTISQ